MGDMEFFDMELHVKAFVLNMNNFDMEFPCQMLLGNNVRNLTWVPCQTHLTWKFHVIYGQNAFDTRFPCQMMHTDFGSTWNDMETMSQVSCSKQRLTWNFHVKYIFPS